MDFIKKLKLIERIDGMITRKSTGTPAELSQKIEVSERTLYNIIKIMKQLGAPIYYSTTRMSYCYNGNVSFSYVFRVEQKISNEDKTENSPYSNISSINGLQKLSSINPNHRVFELSRRFRDIGSENEM